MLSYPGLDRLNALTERLTGKITNSTVPLLVLTLTILLTVGVTTGAQTQPEILIGDETGTPLEVPVSLSSAPNGLFSFIITFGVSDTSVAKFSGATISSQFSSSSFVVEVASDGSWVKVAAGDFGESIGAGATDIHLATLELSVEGSGSTTVSIDSVNELTDDEGSNIDASTSDTGTVTTDVPATTLPAGWHLFSPPGVPQNPDPATALGDDIEPLTLYYDYTSGDGYMVYNGAEIILLTWKEGYWVHLDVETQVDMSVSTSTQDHTLEFTSTGWKMIGVPYNVDWIEVDFSDPKDFATDGAGNVRLVSWSPTKSLYLNHYSDTSYVLDKWSGYWVYVKNASSSEPATFTISKTIDPPPPPGSQSPLSESIDPDELDYPPLPQELEGNFQALAYPNPVMENDQVTFAAQMPDVEKIKVIVRNTAGEMVHDSGYESGNQLTWNLKDTSGNKVTNGIYLYKMQVKRSDGTTQTSEVKRLLVLR